MPADLTRPEDSPHDDWWVDAVTYQVYPRSFADSDGDGLGDLPGVLARLPYLADLGVDAIWLSPCFVSPQHDAGYDVADYRRIDPRFGSLADLDALLAGADALGLRVLLDLVPNHSSSEHPWFQGALAAAPGSPERARYVFRDGRGPRGERPPNNWRSVFGGPAWTRVGGGDAGPAQWYLHLFDATQPDFDWTNPQVRAEFEDILRFWLDRGVAGFRIDVAHGLVKADGLPDATLPQQVLAGIEGQAEPVPTHLTPYWDQDGVHEIYRSWRTVLDSYPGPRRILVAEAWVWPPERMARYLRPDEMHQSFAFDLLESPWLATELRQAIDDTRRSMAGVGAPCTWVLSNHDVVRHATRYGLDQHRRRPHGIRAGDLQPDAALGLRRARAATLLLLGLPGAAYLYQGEELGLPEHTTLPDALRQDPAFRRTGGAEAGRDGCRVPMPWAAEAPGLGFSPTGRTWLPQPPAYAALAADRQTGVAGSTLELYRSALRLRRELGLGRGSLAWLPAPPGGLAWRVTGPTGALVDAVVNLGPDPIALPTGRPVLVSSERLEWVGATCLLPVDTAVWLAG